MSPIDPVVERMTALLEKWDAEGDYRAVFVRSYREITIRVKKAVDNGEFEDGAWLELFDVVFAQSYFDALDTYESGSGTLPLCWKFAFERAVDKRSTVLQDLLMGMNAHIIHDLPVSLVMHGIPPEEREKRRLDHEKVNEILAGMINDVQRETVDHYSWWLGFLDTIGGIKDELLTDAGVRAARREAWIMAVALADAPDEESRARIRERVDRMATAASRLIATKTHLLDRIILKLRSWDRAIAQRRRKAS